MRLLPLLLAVLLLTVSPASAQDDRWQAFPSLRNAQAVTASDEALWVGTDGGVYRYAPDTGEIERFTPVDGLSGVDVEAITYDAARDVVWVGYPDGALDRVDATSGEVQPFFEIAQADRFNARGINRIDVAADSLLISTEFGVVVFDAVRGEVRDTYERFGTLAGGTSVGDVVPAPLPDGQPGLWVGTRGGIAYAPLAAPNLREPSAWTLDTDTLTDVLSLAFFDGTLFAGTERITDPNNGDIVTPGGGYRRVNGQWTRFTSATRSFFDLFVLDDDLIAAAVFQVLRIDGAGQVSSYRLTGAGGFLGGTAGPDGRVWVGDRIEGLIAFPLLEPLEPGVVEPDLRLIPDGPLTNAILDLDVDREGNVWAGFVAPNDRINGFARFDGAAWTNFSLANGALPDRATVRTVHADAQGNVWFGTEGRGVFQYAPDDEVTLYTQENSTLEQSSDSNPDFIIADGVDTDASGRLWATNKFAALPLHLRTPDGVWTALDRPSGVSTNYAYESVYIDSFGQKWITGNRDSGFLVLDTGADPLDVADDRAAVVRSAGSVGTGLPSDEVNAIVEDRSGRLWIGTERGLATVFSPGSIFVGDPAQQITWTRTPDGASFFLRDLRVLDIAVDAADRKWLASDAGAWLINAEGNEVLANFTTENAPLPSDVIAAVDIDDATGAVYFATSGGVYRYDGDALAPSATAEDLFIYPNPVRASGGALPEIAITGLVDRADVRVLTVDGQVVASFDTRGGSVRWDGRDRRTGDLVPSGVYIVAAAGQDGEGTAYGKIAVIR
ncbi:MAG: two-component regulator propeller domain-containing protein [Bacteroidota bacterium]